MAIGSFDMRSIPAALRSNTLYALIAANVSVFVAVAVFGIFDGGRMLSWLVLPSWLPSMLRQPWSVLSYMFVQTDVLHLLFNMLWLYCFGSILLHVNGGRALVRVYVAGGVAGGGGGVGACGGRATRAGIGLFCRVAMLPLALLLRGRPAGRDDAVARGDAGPLGRGRSRVLRGDGDAAGPHRGALQRSRVRHRPWRADAVADARLRHRQPGRASSPTGSAASRRCWPVRCCRRRHSRSIPRSTA